MDAVPPSFLTSTVDPSAEPWVLTPGMTLGREGTNAIQVDDPTTEARHAQFVARAGTWRVVDLDSVHGVFVNDRRIRDGVLHHGDRIRFGRLEFQFHTRPQQPIAKPYPFGTERT